VKIFLISNTLFGHKNHKDFVEYFIKSFVPFIEKYAKPDDMLIHLGGMFNSKSINISVINEVYNIFERLSKSIKIKFLIGHSDKIKNDNSGILFKNIENIDIEIDDIKIENILFYNNKEDKESGFNGYYQNFSSKRVGCPYQLNENDKGKKRGFMVYDIEKNKILFKENTFSKKYMTYKIDNVEDLDKLESSMFKLNNIHIDINRNLYENYENKINVILSQYEVNKVTHYDVESDEIEVFDDILDVETNLRKEINKLDNCDILLQEFDNIIELYEKKFN